MLVLTRKINESIIINEHIKITVLSIDGNKIRLGIEAPRDLTVDREEIHARRQEFADVAVPASRL